MVAAAPASRWRSWRRRPSGRSDCLSPRARRQHEQIGKQRRVSKTGIAWRCSPRRPVVMRVSVVPAPRQIAAAPTRAGARTSPVVGSPKVDGAVSRPSPPGTIVKPRGGRTAAASSAIDVAPAALRQLPATRT
jgi:hypothetical protein